MPDGCLRPFGAWEEEADVYLGLKPQALCLRPCGAGRQGQWEGCSIYLSRSIITTVTSSVTGRPPQKAITRSISASTASPIG